MTTILSITSSPNPEGVSTGLVSRFVEGWTAAQPDSAVVRRDVGMAPPPHLDGGTIGSFFTPPENRDASAQDLVALSDTLVDELEAADIIVIGAPMHNFGLTSGLKAWIDHVSRVGRTFAYTEDGPKGLLAGKGKKVFVLGARGGDYSESSPVQGMDFVTPYLKTILGFMGLNDVTFIHAEGVAMGEEGVKQAHAQIKSTVASLAA